MHEQIDAVRSAALTLGFDEKAADSIGALEARYVDHLRAGGASGGDAAAKLFSADTAGGVFWFKAWKQARQGAGFAL